MEIVLLDKLTLGNVDLSELKSLGNLTSYQTTTKEEASERIKDADIIITNKVKLDGLVLANAKNIKLICIAATGTNNVDHEYCKENNILVKNVVGYSTASVVQLTFSYIFYFIQNLNFYKNFTTSGQWAKQDIFTHFKDFNELSSLRFGIIGLGEIGRNVATIASTFGARVNYYSTSGKNKNSLYESLELDELLRTSDIVTIHAPLNSNTLNLISLDKLELLKEGSILLNLGRGGIINESDLCLFLKKNPKKIKIGLDVLEIEPMVKNHNLLEQLNSENIILTPHIGWASLESRSRLIKGIKDNIVKFITQN